jgi:hypothetical protein
VFKCDLTMLVIHGWSGYISITQIIGSCEDSHAQYCDSVVNFCIHSAKKNCVDCF